MKYITLNNLGSKYNMLMKFGQFMPYYKKKKIHQKIEKKTILMCEGKATSISHPLKLLTNIF